MEHNWRTAFAHRRRQEIYQDSDSCHRSTPTHVASRNREFARLAIAPQKTPRDLAKVRIGALQIYRCSRTTNPTN